MGGGRLGGAPGSIVTTDWELARDRGDDRFVQRLLTVAGLPRYVVSAAGSMRFPFIPLAGEMLFGVERVLLHRVRSVAP